MMDLTLATTFPLVLQRDVLSHGFVDFSFRSVLHQV